MLETIHQEETAPEAYPDPPEGLAENAAELDAAMLWQRIEDYTAWRWTPRAVTWIVQGRGEWRPPLAPASVTQAYTWSGSDWSEIELSPAPLGYSLRGGRYKIEATVGADNPAPEAVQEAYRRLAEYLSGRDRGPSGTSNYSATIGSSLSESWQRSPAWIARAMVFSGAADLLRRYRRV